MRATLQQVAKRRIEAARTGRFPKALGRGIHHQGLFERKIFC